MLKLQKRAIVKNGGGRSACNEAYYLLEMGCDAVNGSAHRRSEKDKDLEEELENPMGSVGL